MSKCLTDSFNAAKLRHMFYTKVFDSLVTSTIWAESNETRIVWITMLALRNSQNVVEASLPGLAHVSRISLEDTQRALERLESPDPHSRSQENEGRRIAKVEGGWLILNGAKYSRRMSKDDQKEYFRVKQAEHRQRVRSRKKKNEALVGERSFVAAVERGASEQELNKLVDHAGHEAAPTNL